MSDISDSSVAPATTESGYRGRRRAPGQPDQGRAAAVRAPGDGYSGKHRDTAASDSDNGRADGH